MSDLTKEELLELVYLYDLYIQYANDTDLYENEWYPVCIEEFLQNDMEEWREIGAKST